MRQKKFIVIMQTSKKYFFGFCSVCILLLSGCGTADDVNQKEQLESEIDSMPAEIKRLLDYYDGVDNVEYAMGEALSDNILEEFKSILQGDVSVIQGLRSEEERNCVQGLYENKNDWGYLFMDLDENGIQELCMKDRNGGIAAFYEVYGDLYMPGLLLIWTMGESGVTSRILGNICDLDDYYASYFLDNGEILDITKFAHEGYISTEISIHQFTEMGTMPEIDAIKIYLVFIAEVLEEYSTCGIYYKKCDAGEIQYHEISEEEAVEWVNDRVYPYLIPEEQWNAVP